MHLALGLGNLGPDANVFDRFGQQWHPRVSQRFARLVRRAKLSWAVNGGSTVDSATGSGTATYVRNGLITIFSINVTDPTYSDVLSLNGNANGARGSLTGTTVLASFTLDNAGNGTISFANGSQEQVQG
jgi:hypothetical protein